MASLLVCASPRPCFVCRLFALHQKGFDDANKKLAQMSKELEARNSQLHSESIIMQECERRLQVRSYFNSSTIRTRPEPRSQLTVCLRAT